MTGNQKSSLMSLCPLGCNASKRFCTNWGSHLALCTLCSLSFEHTPLHSVVLQEILKIFFLNKNQFLPNLRALFSDYSLLLIFSTRQIDDIQPLSFDTECNSRMYEMCSGGANIGSGPTNWAFWTRKTKSVRKWKKRDSKQVSSAWPWDSKETF